MNIIKNRRINLKLLCANVNLNHIATAKHNVTAAVGCMWYSSDYLSTDGTLTQVWLPRLMQLRPYSNVSEFTIHDQKAPVGHLSLPDDLRLIQFLVTSPIFLTQEWPM